MAAGTHIRLRPAFMVAIAAAAATLSACGSSSSSGTSTEAQAASSGDIPDNQQFLVYRNQHAGYSVKYPEGWARQGPAKSLTFSDKDNSVHVVITNGKKPTPAAARAALEHSVPPSDALKVKTVQATKVGGAPGVHITYDRRGPPDPVTGKRLTLMVDRYVLAQGGRVATVDESTPVGVDNVDAYRLIINSFAWL